MPKRKIHKEVLAWVERASLHGPIFIEHRQNVYVHQDGKQIHVARMGDRFDLAHDGSGKITGIGGVPI